MSEDALVITRLAERLIREREVGDDALRRSARVVQALQVLAPDGRPHSWFVPVTLGNHLAAFLQILPNGTLLRFSSFQRRPGDNTNLPPIADWLDLERIRLSASSRRREGETVGDPYLTFDKTPERIVWAVPLKDAQGHSRRVFVLSGTIYEQSQNDTIG